MFAAAAHALADIVDDKQEEAAGLPILAKEAHEDVEYATNVVVLSTLSFVAVVPILMTVLQFIRSSDSALFFVEKNIVIFI